MRCLPSGRASCFLRERADAPFIQGKASKPGLRADHYPGIALSLTPPPYAPTVPPFPMSSREHQDRPTAGRREPTFPARFDKAFPVYLEGERGVAAGIGRNITQNGMFVETREPFPLGSRVRVTFTSPGRGPEMVLEGEVRYQCFINYARADQARAGMRAIGLRFVTPRSVDSTRKGAIH